MAPVRISVFGHPRWEADSDGDVFLDGNLAHYGGDGHGRVMASSGYRGSGYHAQRRSTLVCTAWHGPKPFPGAQVNHKNDIPTDDRPSNVYWGTQAQNIQDSVRNFTHNFVTSYGDKHYRYNPSRHQ